MLKTNFYINGKRIKEPLNYKELSIELNFDKDDPSFRGQVSTNQWELGLGSNTDDDGANIINQYINGGVTGGIGVFEGLDFRIELENNGSSQDLFKGYLDISEASILCDKIIASATESGMNDWLNQVADSFTFEYLYDDNGVPVGGAGKILDSDFAKVPYLISTVPDVYTAAITGVTLFTIFTSIGETTSSLIEKVPELTIPNFGHIVTFVLLLIQLIILLITAIILVVQIFRALVPFVKYQAGMYVYTLCQKASEYLGLEFNSTILESDPFNKLLILPETFVQFEPNDPNGSGSGKRFIDFSNALLGVSNKNDFERVGFYRGTFGDLLRELKNMFNAKLIITDNELRLERVDYISNVPQYTIPKLDRSKTPYTFNFEEYYSNYNLSFSTDLNDSNVVQNYLGTEVQVITKPRSVIQSKNLIGGNTKQIKLGFARGIRRTKQNFIERMFRDVFDNLVPLIFESEKITKTLLPVIQPIAIILNKVKNKFSALGILFNTPQKPPIPNNSSADTAKLLQDLIFRKQNVLLLENDAVSVPKMLLMNQDYNNGLTFNLKLDVRNDTVVNAEYLYKNYRNITTFVGNNHNQHLIYELDNIPFCINDYENVKQNNTVYEADGITKATIISLKWNVYNQTASIKYKVKRKYTDNLIESIIYSDGR